MQYKIIDQTGVFYSSSEIFKVFCRYNKAGGAKDIYVFKKDEPIFYAGDVISFLWIGDILIYVCSPLYGKGKTGIRYLDTISELDSTLIYDNPNSYYKLQDYDSKTRILRYYYWDDVETLDESKLADSKNLKWIEIPNNLIK